MLILNTLIPNTNAIPTLTDHVLSSNDRAYFDYVPYNKDSSYSNSNIEDDKDASPAGEDHNSTELGSYMRL